MIRARSLPLPSILALAVASALGCQKQTPPAPSPAAPAPSSVASNSAGTVTGVVLEKIDTAGYSYLHLRTAQGETWAAVPQADVKTGATVTVFQQMVEEHFTSKSLQRTFDKVIFGTLQGETTAARPQEVPLSENIRSGEQLSGPVKTEKATGPNAKTISELFATRASVKDQPVAVRGKVVKFLPRIMGKNWLHLRDGSGTDAAKDDDLTVTTLDTAAVGDVVTAQGTARVDKDFGAGYRYPVMIEDAKLTK